MKERKLLVNIEEIEDLPEKQKTIPFNEVIDSLENGNPVSGSITVTVLGPRVIVEGSAETDVMLECDRCLEQFPCHVVAEIYEIFLKGSLDTELKKEVELTEKSFVEELHGKNEINITDLIYQEIVLNIPSHKLCKEECEGGEFKQNDNNENIIDSRLEVFKNYFNNDNNK